MLRVILNKTEVEFPSSKPSMAYPGINSKFFIITVHINTSFLLTSLVSSHRDRLCLSHYAPAIPMGSRLFSREDNFLSLDPKAHE
jgi:hypothetical protein